MGQSNIFELATEVAESLYLSYYEPMDPLNYKSDLMIATLLEKFDINAEPYPFSVKSFCGALKSDQFGVSIVYNKYHFPPRRNFTLAHELGHYFLHRKSAYSYFLDNIKSLSEYIDSDIEKQANVFASELLIPQKVLEAMLLNRFSFFRIAKSTNTSYECTKWRIVRHLMSNYRLSRDQSLLIVDEYRQMSTSKVHAHSKLINIISCYPITLAK